MLINTTVMIKMITQTMMKSLKNSSKRKEKSNLIVFKRRRLHNPRPRRSLHLMMTIAKVSVIRMMKIWKMTKTVIPKTIQMLKFTWMRRTVTPRSNSQHSQLKWSSRPLKPKMRTPRATRLSRTPTVLKMMKRKQMTQLQQPPNQRKSPNE